MEEVKAKLVETAIVLLDNHNVKQKDIFTWIRNALLDHVLHLPKVKVLYNKRHGGFGFSEEFEKFVDMNIEEEDKEKVSGTAKCIMFRGMFLDRTLYVKYIIPFARHVLSNSKLSGVRDLLYTYHYYNMGKVLSLIRLIITKEHERKVLMSNGEHLRDYLSNMTSKYYQQQIIDDDYIKITDFILKIKDFKGFDRYKKEELEGLYALFIEGTFTKSIDDTICESQEEILTHISNDVLLEIRLFIEQSIKDDQHNKKATKDFYGRDDDELQFVQLLNKKGHKDKDTWRHQLIYDTMAIRYLIAKQHSFDNVCPNTIKNFIETGVIEVDEIVLANVEETFGLLCASGGYANLALADVPAMLDWQICEYDGLESVVVI
jgi:hypothetical protein